MKHTLSGSFRLRCSLLLFFNALLVLFNQCGLGAWNGENECALMSSDNLLISMVFTAADLILFFLAFLDVFGVIPFVFFCVLVNEKRLRELRLRTILLSAAAVSLSGYLILYIPDFKPELLWFADALKEALLFSVLPAVTAVCIKYALWKLRDRRQNREGTDG